jgi:hypothetical protein
MIYKAVKGRTSYGLGMGIIQMDLYMPFPPGTPGNASGLPFPVTYSVVTGATADQMFSPSDPELVQKFIDAGWDLVNKGVKGITGDCGFMVYYQDILSKELPVPVCMSSLMQLPLVNRLLKPEEKVGIVSANSNVLKHGFLEIACGGEEIPVACTSLDGVEYFWKAVLGEGFLDFEKVEQEVVDAAKRVVADDPAVSAILLECTDLPPYAAAVQEAVYLPVYDWRTMVEFMFSGLVRERYHGYM